jgi:putative spermidine/putrescine transport system substrate-binding protein
MPHTKLATAAVFAALVLAVPGSEAYAQATLKVATWAGAYAEAQKIAVFDPFSKDTGTRIDASLQAGAAGISGGDWDVADLSSAEASAMCDKGLLETIDASAIKAGSDGTAANSDFLPGGIEKCAIGSLAWSAVILYSTEPLDTKDANGKVIRGKPLAAPKSVKDFFDVAKYPGKRGLPRNPRYVMELAMLADGVPAAEVYRLLGTEAGRKRAFRRLSTIRSQLVWWSDPQDAMTALKAKTVSMTLGYSGRAFMEIATGTKPIKILWDSQIYDIDMWAVSKTSRNKADALKFVAYASSTERLADSARQLPYGPMRRSAVGMVGNHAILGTDLKPFLPTYPDNFVTALRLDGSFWRQNEAELSVRLDNWIENSPESAGVGKPG